MSGIEILARAVIVADGKLLLCRTKGAKRTYLPGGHVEHGESARSALAREIREELGKKARVGRFLGAVEHAFTQKGKRVHEVNFLFATTIPGLASVRDPVARESHVEFFWRSLSPAALGAARLEPLPLRRLLCRWLKAGASAGWASTLE